MKLLLGPIIRRICGPQEKMEHLTQQLARIEAKVQIAEKRFGIDDSEDDA